MATGTNAWIEDELAGCHLADERLGRRLRTLLDQMTGSIGDSIPLACQDWANTKAAYRFLANDRVSEVDILSGHFAATRQRVAATPGPILVLQDTTEFSFHREHPEKIGQTCRVNSGPDKDGRFRMHTVCGLLMHASLAVTPEGLPLGLGAVKFWTRKKFKGAAALKRKINPTRVPIEQKESIRWLENLRLTTELFDDPDRCIHIGDRESDIYELFCSAREMGTHFLVRTCVDRLALGGDTTMDAVMGEAAVEGVHTVDVRDGHGHISTTQVELTYRSLRILPPIGKQKRYPALTLTVLRVQERDEPADRPRINWKLLTDLPVATPEAAMEKVRWYAVRWKIEVFHKILKSGCKAEEARLRTADRLVKLIAVYCLVSWRVFWLTMINRSAPDVDAGVVFTELEQNILDFLIPNKTLSEVGRSTLGIYLTKVAKLGGYLARGCDPPPGNTVMWRGMARLIDITLGAEIAHQVVGN